MKYIIACLISFGVVTSSMAQSGSEIDEEEGSIACFFLDENTIACFQEPLEGEDEDTLHPEGETEIEQDTTQVEKRKWDMERREDEEEFNTVQTFNYPRK